MSPELLLVGFPYILTSYRKNGRRPQRVMKPAGLLTHGGFYRRFASKGELVAEACREAVSSGTCLIRLRRGAIELDCSAIVVAF
jgi:hypothetical protein